MPHYTPASGIAETSQDVFPSRAILLQLQPPEQALYSTGYRLTSRQVRMTLAYLYNRIYHISVKYVCGDKTPLRLKAILCHLFMTLRSAILCGMPCKVLSQVLEQGFLPLMYPHNRGILCNLC